MGGAASRRLCNSSYRDPRSIALRIAKRKGARKHRCQHAVPEDKMMVEPSERMEPRDPPDRVSQPGMDVREGRTCVMRKCQDGWNLHAPKQGQRVPFQPRADNGGERDGEEQQV